jgi:hypothetical protein
MKFGCQSCSKTSVLAKAQLAKAEPLIRAEYEAKIKELEVINHALVDNQPSHDEQVKDIQRQRDYKEIGELKKCVSELLDAMHRYEIDVEVEAPITHREMIKRAEKALAESNLKAGKTPDKESTK